MVFLWVNISGYYYFGIANIIHFLVLCNTKYYIFSKNIRTYIYSRYIFSLEWGGRREKITIFDFPMLRFTRQLRLTDTMKEFEFTRTVVPLRNRIFRYAQSLLLCADEAEDVTHDLLERLWRDRDRLDGCRSIVSFVMTAARNSCYDRLRQRQAGERRDNALAGWAERSTTGDAEGWEVRELVRRAMARLPERQREVLHLKDIEGYPTREIAQTIACDEAQVRVILSRARNGLREVLKKMMDDERAERKD